MPYDEIEQVTSKDSYNPLMRALANTHDKWAHAQTWEEVRDICEPLIGTELANSEHGLNALISYLQGSQNQTNDSDLISNLQSQLKERYGEPTHPTSNAEAIPTSDTQAMPPATSVIPTSDAQAMPPATQAIPTSNAQAMPPATSVIAPPAETSVPSGFAAGDQPGLYYQGNLWYTRDEDGDMQLVPNQAASDIANAIAGATSDEILDPVYDQIQREYELSDEEKGRLKRAHKELIALFPRLVSMPAADIALDIRDFTANIEQDIQVIEDDSDGDLES
jgi:hypothetical protein